MRTNGLSLRAQLLVKRGIDLVVALALLLLLGPTMVAIGVTVSATSPGGPLFNQVRAGRDGRPFTIHKFRTMTGEDRGRDERYSRAQTEARVTRVGRILRRLSLDELPQLLNIVRGDMSLVGPRPDTMRHAEAYSAFQRRRLAVRPGVTGLAQIRGRNEIPWEERIRLDVEYIDRWSLWLDLRILAETAVVVVTGKGTKLPWSRR